MMGWGFPTGKEIQFSEVIMTKKQEEIQGSKNQKVTDYLASEDHQRQQRSEERR